MFKYLFENEFSVAIFTVAVTVSIAKMRIFPNVVHYFRLFALKLYLYWFCVYYCLTCKEQILFESKLDFEPFESKKEIVFIRHAESTWNELSAGHDRDGIFQRIKTVFWYLKWEILYFLRPNGMGSNVIDAPLSLAGKCQVEKARYQECKKLDKWSCDEKTVILCSNLRRAEETMIGLFPLIAYHRRFHIVSLLQEIGRGVDTLALQSLYDALQEKIFRIMGKNTIENQVQHHCQVVHDLGCKSIRDVDINRPGKLLEFVHQHCSNYDRIVVVGHSMFFRAFLQQYLGNESECILPKTKKLANCSILSMRCGVKLESASVHLIHGQWHS